jgi:nucleotide-binding universal stress UspA family protein
MTIVCGTDFSPPSRQAARAAAALASRFGERLVLAHVVDELGAGLTPRGPDEDVYRPQREQLRRDASELGLPAASVEVALLPGAIDVTLTDVARQRDARLLVVSSLGRRPPARWLLGSVAERAARSAPLPVLIVRGADAFEAWGRGERRLRVLLGVDGSPEARAAVTWVAELRRAGPCDVTAVYVASPPEEHSRLGVPGPMPLDSIRPELEGLLQREVAAFVGELPGEGQLTTMVRPGLGRVGYHLAMLAEGQQVDLLVVGTHHRTGAALVWQGSVSRDAVRLAAMSVACVPAVPPAATEPVPVPRFARVLAATDLSAWSNRAVGYAYALVADGGTIRLFHALAPDLAVEPSEAKARCEAALRGLVPPEAATRRIVTTVEVVEGPEPAVAILAAAERLGADALCVATRARQGFSRAAFGSVAQRVLVHGHRPVFLVPPPGEQGWAPAAAPTVSAHRRA